MRRHRWVLSIENFYLSMNGTLVGQPGRLPH